MIYCIVGPTGVGKTALSIRLAKKLNAIIINADAMQVYKGLNIGTAKIKEEEKEGIPHYLFDFVDVTNNYTIYDYQKDARKIIEETHDKNIIFVGGSGLYLKAALYDYQLDEEKQNDNNYDNLTNEELYKLANQKNINHGIHQNNRKRLIRFLNKKSDLKTNSPLLYNAIFIGLTTNRDNLYNIINKRVDQMFDEGLLDEVKYYYDLKINSKALNTGIGYKELYQYFDNKITLDQAKELIKKNSRHYAKRQYTFFNNQIPVKYFQTNYENFDKTVDEVFEYINNCQ